jgi:hypothetical protein
MPADDLDLDALGRREAEHERDCTSQQINQRRPECNCTPSVRVREAERDALVARARAYERIVDRECVTRGYNSRVCENGTNGCEVRHQ